MVFLGRFRPASFTAFVRDRAARLALDATIEELGPQRITLVVAGQPGLVDAFEMACSLGPLDCLVLDVARCEAEAMEMRQEP
jgi:acylphosphatase